MVAARARGRGLRRTVCVALAAIVVAASIALACGPGDLDDLTRGRADAGTDVDAAADSGPPDAAVCVHASAPDRPTSLDAVNGPELLLAFSDVRFDTGEDDGGGLPKPRSLDLDQTCTCPEPESCIPPDAGMPRPCDGPMGRDNVVGPLLATVLQTGSGFGPQAASDQLRAGDFGILLLIQGWNGLPDDPDVAVGVAISNGIDGVQDDAGRRRPLLDGQDVWTVTPASLVAGVDLVGQDCRALDGGKSAKCLPSRADPRSYVKDGVLVAHVDIPLPLLTATGFFEIDFVASTLTGKLTKTGSVYRLDGEIAGRWPIDRLLPTLARLHNPATNTALCASDAGLEIYDIVKQGACGSVDLATSPAFDRTGAPCDALSNAISFSATTAILGPIFQATRVLPNDCPDFSDHCSR